MKRFKRLTKISKKRSIIPIHHQEKNITSWANSFNTTRNSHFAEYYLSRHVDDVDNGNDNDNDDDVISNKDEIYDSDEVDDSDGVDDPMNDMDEIYGLSDEEEDDVELAEIDEDEIDEELSDEDE